MKYTPVDGFLYYIELLGETAFLDAFESLTNTEILNQISEQSAHYRYAPEKWSIKQILGHITDHERIMMYRVLRFSRNDQALLPGYDEQHFMQFGRFNDLSFQSLINDYKNVRTSTLSLIASLSVNQLNYVGVASGYSYSVTDFLKSTIGHEIHHFNILKERYLPLL